MFSPRKVTYDPNVPDCEEIGRYSKLAAQRSSL